MTTSRITRILVALATVLFVTGERSSAYNPLGSKWAALDVPFYLNPVNGDIYESAAIAAIDSAAAAWSQQANTSFTFHRAGFTNSTTINYNGRNEVFFRNASNGSAIATTYVWSSGDLMLETDIVFWDGAYRFFTGSSGCAGGFYVEDVATHEFGHALGLGHSAVAEATMFSGAGYCSTNMRSLELDDRQGVEALYPAVAANPPAVRIVTPASGATFAAGSVVTLTGTAQDAEDGDLSGQIEWSSDVQGWLGNGGSVSASLSSGPHTLTARVLDSQGLPGTATVSIVMASPSPDASSSAVTLSGTGRKVKRQLKADLRWSGGFWPAVDIYRNGTRRATVANTGSYTDSIGAKGGGCTPTTFATPRRPIVPTRLSSRSDDESRRVERSESTRGAQGAPLAGIYSVRGQAPTPSPWPAGGAAAAGPSPPVQTDPSPAAPCWPVQESE